MPEPLPHAELAAAQSSLNDLSGDTTAAVPIPPPPTDTRRPLPRVEGYEVLAELGQGGMGIVYKALHVQLKRVVALTLQPAAGLSATDWDELLGRFRREAEALARLKHAHVVEVYDIGGTSAQLPYIALEFCPGGSLEKKLNGTPLPPAEAAALARQIALGVQAAHEARVVHRDLKPGNVLLAEVSGVASAPRDLIPKVTDFGLAKKLDETGQTQAGAIFGTASYMAPEQAQGRNDDVGPAADVYAVGAVLYECLTGRPPFRAATVVDTLIQVIGDEPVAPRQLNPKVPRDLETICLKCLRKEPARRYGSAKELADDLGRFERGEAILARPVGAIERTVKWSRRHPAVAALLTLLTAVVIGAGTTITLLYIKAIHERDLKDEQRRQAEHNLKLAKKAVNECFGIAKNNELLQQEEMKAIQKLLLEKALPFYKDFRVLQTDDPETRRELAEQLFRVGFITDKIGEQSKSIEAYRQSRDLYQQLVEDEPEVLRHQTALAATLNNLATLLKSAGKRGEALAAFRRAERLQTRALDLRPDADEYRDDLAGTLNNLGVMFDEEGKKVQARRAYRQASRLQEKLVANRPKVAAYWRGLARTLTNLAGLLRTEGKRAEAMKVYRRSCDVQERLIEALPRVGVFRDHLAGTLTNLGLLLAEEGNRPEALTVYRRARQYREKLVQTQPDVTAYRAGLANTLNNLGLLLKEDGRRAEAAAAFRQSRDLLEVVVKQQRGSAFYRKELGRTLVNLGLLFAEEGKFALALPLYNRARDLFTGLVKDQQKVAEHQVFLADTLVNLGVLWDDNGNPEEARQSYEQALRWREKLAEDHPDVPDYRCEVGRTLVNLGRSLSDSGKPADALALYRRARPILEKLVKGHPTVTKYREALATLLNSMGMALKDNRKPDEAMKHYREARVLREKLVAAHPRVGKYRNDLASTCHNMGNILGDEKKLTEAANAYRKAVAIREDLLKEHQAVTEFRFNHGGTLYTLARVLEQDRKHAEALKIHRQGRVIRQKLVADHPRVAAYRADLAETLARLGLLLQHENKDEALSVYEQAGKLLEALVKAHPGNIAYRKSLARNYGMRGLVLSNVGRYRDALTDLNEAIAQMRRLPEREMRSADVRGAMMAYHLFRAETLGRMNRWRQALADWDQVVELAPPAIRVALSRGKVYCLARLDDYRQAMSAAQALAKVTKTGADWYELARIAALSAAAAARDRGRPLPRREQTAERYARQAVAWLHDARKANLFAPIANRSLLQKEVDLAAIRGRDDFKGLLRTINSTN